MRFDSAAADWRTSDTDARTAGVARSAAVRAAERLTVPDPDPPFDLFDSGR